MSAYFWFGEPWGAPVNETNPQCAVPLGRPCHRCERTIALTDRGFIFQVVGGRPNESIVFHHACFLESITG